MGVGELAPPPSNPHNSKKESILKSVLVARHAAFGDMVHVSHVPRLLKDNGYDIVGFSTGKRGAQILKNNPFIDRLHYAELSDFTRQLGIEYFNTRLMTIGREYDTVINLNQIIEVGALPGQYQKEYFLDQKTRDRMGSDNYYDIATKAAGFPHLQGKYRGELFFSKDEEEIVAKSLAKHQSKFKLLINLSGSSPHKVFVQAREVIDRVKLKYPEAVIFTTGDKLSESIDSDADGVIKLSIKKPFRQVLLMCKYMECVIGCESGMVCGSSCLGTPTIQLMTAASLKNHVQYAENDYSLQSPARCSPCHKNPYDYWGCPTKDNYPLCVFFEIDKIMSQIEEIHSKWATANSNT